MTKPPAILPVSEHYAKYSSPHGIMKIGLLRKEKAVDYVFVFTFKLLPSSVITDYWILAVYIFAFSREKYDAHKKVPH